MPNRISFEAVDAAVEKIYRNTTEAELDKNCHVIEALIVGAGWTLDQYLERVVQANES